MLFSKSYYKFESDYCTLINGEPQISNRKIIKGSYIKLADRPISKCSVQIKPMLKKLTKMKGHHNSYELSGTVHSKESSNVLKDWRIIIVTF